MKAAHLFIEGTKQAKKKKKEPVWGIPRKEE